MVLKCVGSINAGLASILVDSRPGYNHVVCASEWRAH